jgi:hypothetical protein
MIDTLIPELDAFLHAKTLDKFVASNRIFCCLETKKLALSGLSERHRLSNFYFFAIRSNSKDH